MSLDNMQDKAHASHNKNILVTGAHRSGSTWIGEVLATAPGVNYIHEPFNIFIHKQETIFENWFEYIPVYGDINDKRAKQYIDQYIGMSFWKTMKEAVSLKNADKDNNIIKRYLKFKLSNRQLIKDPIAMMSAAWMAQVFGLDVVVIFRHPAAFSASLKVKDWQFNFNWFLNQKNLLRDYLFPFRNDIERMAKERGDIIDQAILLWNCIYHVAHIYKDRYPGWMFIRHEDVSMNPLKEFNGLFDRLGLKWSPKVEKFINDSTRKVRSSEYNLTAKENIYSWKQRLNHSEINRIKEGTFSVSKYFYSEAEW